MDCPCGSELTYAACCAPVHENGAGLGKTAEALMRARYSGYVMGNNDFLLRSWHPDTRPLDMGQSDPSHEWIELEIVGRAAGGALDSSGTVEFKARFQRGGEFFELHELSTFERVDGQWVYVDGVQPEE